MSHFSCFFFRKRRNKRNQTEREKRRKATAVSLGVLEKRLFRIKCSDRFSSLRRDCGDEPRPQIRQYRICSSPQMVGGGCSFATRRENCNDCQHIGGVICSLIAMRVAVIACGWRTTTGRPCKSCRPNIPPFRMGYFNYILFSLPLSMRL